MKKTCLKCGATAEVADSALAACPACGAIYAKVEALQAGGKVVRQTERSASQPVAAEASPVVAPTDGDRRKTLLALFVGAVLCSIIFAIFYRAVLRERERLATSPPEVKTFDARPYTLLTVGKRFKNKEFHAMLDEHYPGAVWRTDQNVLIMYDSSRYEVGAEKVGSELAPDYKILFVRHYAEPRISTQEPVTTMPVIPTVSCDDLDQYLRQRGDNFIERGAKVSDARHGRRCH